MTDREALVQGTASAALLRKVAEIEGISWHPKLNRPSRVDDWEIPGGTIRRSWNPLEKDADAFALETKLLEAGWTLFHNPIDNHFYWISQDFKHEISDPDLKTAICKAVVAANE